MALYIGDLCEKDRIYNAALYKWNFQKPGFVVEGIILTPDYDLESFYASTEAISSRWSKIGAVEISHKGEMDAIENMLNMVTSDPSHHFNVHKFQGFILLKSGCTVSKEFNDFLHVGMGYLGGKKRNKDGIIPIDKRDYKGPFLHFVVRGRNERKSALTDEFLRSLETIEQSQMVHST